MTEAKPDKFLDKLSEFRHIMWNPLPARNHSQTFNILLQALF